LIIEWSITDEDEEDDYFSLGLAWAQDTTGFWENPDSLLNFPDENLIFISFLETEGFGSKTSNIDGLIQEGDTLYILGFVSDGVNAVYAVSSPIVLSVGGENSPCLLTDSILRGIYPNPFNQDVEVEFVLPTTSAVRLGVYDINGRRMAVLAEGRYGTGQHRLKWHPQSLPAGIYAVRLQTESADFWQKAVYLP